MELPNEYKKQILEHKLLQLEGEYYSLQIDRGVAVDLENEQRQKSIEKSMKQVKRAIKKVEGMMGELD